MEETDAREESDFFWETIGPLLFNKKRLLEAPKEVENVIALLELKPGARILDLGCGVGRHSLEFARRGFHVTGVDRTMAYIEIAREQAERDGLTAEFIRDDIKKFCRPYTYDAAVNMFSSFGYFKNANENRQIIINMYKSLKGGGILLVDMMGKEVMARHFRERDWYVENDIIVLEEKRPVKNWAWMENNWTFIKGGVQQQFKIHHRLYSAIEFAALLTVGGFKEIHIYGDLLGRPYDHEATRLVAVAKK